MNSKLTPQNTATWHDRTTAEHKSLVDKWAADGFRTLSLSIYGDPSDLRYAAVMVKRPSVHAESQVSPRTEAQLQNDFHDNANQGRGPYIITATGPANAPVFAACFRPMNTIPFTRLNLSHDAFVADNAERHAKGRDPAVGRRFRRRPGCAVHGNLGAQSRQAGMEHRRI